MKTLPPDWTEQELEGWIGRQETGEELLSLNLAQRFHAALPAVTERPASAPASGDAAALGLHWCLAPIAEPPSRLGRDGHPELGTHLPPVPLPRRMWAGGALTFHDPLLVGDQVRRTSTIEAITLKKGRSGPLVFVRVRHDYQTPRGLCLQEHQDLVYREDPAAAQQAEAAPQPPSAPPAAEHSAVITTDPVLLFRYSALTFNGHRIHYDADYARTVEGYGGLVVHGPLIATLLAQLAQAVAGPLAGFSYRGQTAAICGETLTLNAQFDSGGLSLTALGADGRLLMTAAAHPAPA